jgi:hypothetical protein
MNSGIIVLSGSSVLLAVYLLSNGCPTLESIDRTRLVMIISAPRQVSGVNTMVFAVEEVVSLSESLKLLFAFSASSMFKQMPAFLFPFTKAFAGSIFIAG